MFVTVLIMVLLVNGDGSYDNVNGGMYRQTLPKYQFVRK